MNKLTVGALLRRAEKEWQQHLANSMMAFSLLRTIKQILEEKPEKAVNLLGPIKEVLEKADQ